MRSAVRRRYVRDKVRGELSARRCAVASVRRGGVPSPAPDAILASYAPLPGTKCALHVSVAKRRSGGGPYALRRCSIWVEELFSVLPYIEGRRVGAGVGATRLGRIPSPAPDTIPKLKDRPLAVLFRK